VDVLEIAVGVLPVALGLLAVLVVAPEVPAAVLGGAVGVDEGVLGRR
jgi:hypothetical protein